jgi:hypothetical protein
MLVRDGRQPKSEKSEEPEDPAVVEDFAFGLLLRVAPRNLH